MLRKELSQSEMAVRLGVPIRSFSTKMQRLQEANKGNTLGRLLEEHAHRKMKRKVQTAEEYFLMCIALDDYEEEHPLGEYRYGNRNSLDIRREYLQRVVSLVEKGRGTKATSEELTEKSVSDSYYRKCKAELATLNQIMERD
jgi:hypothetical protein